MHTAVSRDLRTLREVHATRARGAWLGLALTFAVAGCSTVNPLPFSDAAKTPRQEYLYGPASNKIVALVDEAESKGEQEAADEPKVSEDEADEDEDEAEDLEVVVVTAGKGDDSTSENHAVGSVAGSYKGTDWVTITLPGFPDDEQVDHKARVVLTVLDKPERYSFAVLDTNTGDELCKIAGTLSDTVITFDEEQTCFSGILGVPMDANIATGIATVDGKSLTVTLGVELSVDTPNGELTGDLDYRFEGKR